MSIVIRMKYPRGVISEIFTLVLIGIGPSVEVSIFVLRTSSSG